MHKNHPYAKSTDLLELSQQTQMEISRIKKWLHNQRVRRIQKMGLQKPSKYFTIEDKKILQNFFSTISSRPGPEDLANLAKMMQKDEKKIRSWFNNARFGKSKKNMPVA